MQLIERSRHPVAWVVNAELTLLYWHVGQRIHRDVLGHEWAEYRQQVIPGRPTYAGLWNVLGGEVPPAVHAVCCGLFWGVNCIHSV
jgi:hypothetical protein